MRTNGRDGALKARAGDYAALIVDRMLPGLDGLSLVRGLRAEGIRTPILFLTTESDDGVKAEAKAAGATGWLVKPFVPDQLLRVVGKVLSR